RAARLAARMDGTRVCEPPTRARPPARLAKPRPARSRRRGRGGARRRGHRAAPARAAGSIRVPVAEAQPESLDEDLQVEAERPALDAVEVVLDALLDRGVAAPPVDLRPPGDPGLHLVTQHVA